MNSSFAASSKKEPMISPPHHPDVLASLCAQAFDKVTDRLGDEVDARRHGGRWRPPREHIVHGICTEAPAHLQTPVEGLAAEDLGIGGPLDFRETVEAFGAGRSVSQSRLPSSRAT